MFINTLPLRLTQADESIVDAVRSTQRAVVHALQHAHVPLYEIVAAQGSRRTVAHSMLFQAMFQVNSVDQSMVEGSENSIQEPTVKVDLEMQLFHVDGEVGGQLIYDSAIYNSSTVRQWIYHYQRLLDLGLEQPEVPLQAISIYDDTELSVREYWRGQLLEGRLPVLELPLDFARPPVRIAAGDCISMVHAMVLSAHLAHQLKVIGSEYNCTLFHVVLALWGLLLCRHSGQDEVVVGVPAKGDGSSTACALALRIQVPRTGSFAGLLGTVRESLAGAVAHAQLPFERIADELLPYAVHNTTHHPVFQTVFTWGGVRLLASNIADCDISFNGGQAEDGGIDATIAFSAELFERGSIARLAAHLTELATSTALKTECDAWTLDMLPADELECVLWRFNDTRETLPGGVCVHELVIMQATLTPNAFAVEWHGDRMTYAVLVKCSEGVAAWLFAHDAAPDRVVALQLHRSLEQVVGMLGVLLSGSAYLPLDPKWPAERRQFMTEDAECEQLVAQTTQLLGCRWFCGAVLPLDDAWSLLGSESPVLSGGQRVTPQHLAYVMYTSGSTGSPKGVMVPHVGVVNLLLGARMRYQADAATLFGVPTPYVFDVSVYNIFASLVVHCGTCLLLEDGTSLATLKVDDKLTRVSAVPSILAIARLPSTVTHVEVGGEALTQKAVDSVPMGVSIYNYYGPTEVAIWATRREVVRHDLPFAISSIGRPLPNVTCYIVDPESALHSPQLQPVGVFGELWLGGVQVARGYLKRPEKTAEVFIPHPWPQTDPSGRGVVYRTGDRARWRADGDIEFGGRIDFQVKLRGQRIELGEIEHALSSQPGAAEAIVLLRTDLQGEPTLVAYVLPTVVMGTSPDDGCNAVPFDRVAMLGGARDTLPLHMLPLLVVGVDEWPRTSSNKIDRKRLPVPIVRRTPPEKPSRTAVELTAIGTTAVLEGAVSKLIFKHLSDTLRLQDTSQLDPHVPLMDLGLNSLQLVVLMRSLSEEVGTVLHPTMCFEYPSLHRLTAAIEERLHVHVSNARVDLQQNPIGSMDEAEEWLGMDTLSSGSVNPHPRVCRCLMLHGLAANAQLMQEMMHTTGWLDQLATKVKFVFIDALHEHVARPDLYRGLADAGLYGAELGNIYYDYGYVS